MKRYRTFPKRRWKDWMEREQQGAFISLGDRDLVQTTGSQRSFGRLRFNSSHQQCSNSPAVIWNNTKRENRKDSKVTYSLADHDSL